MCSSDLSDLRVDPSERFSNTTSETAKSLGKTLDMSPKVIDQLIRGYTGAVGPALVSVIDALTGPSSPVEEPEQPLSKVPFLGQIFKHVDGNALIDLAVDTLNEAERVKNTYQKLLQEPGGEAKAEKYLQENLPLIERGRMAGKFRERLGQYKKAEDEVRRSSASAPEKASQLRELKQMKIQEAKEYQIGRAHV